MFNVSVVSLGAPPKWPRTTHRVVNILTGPTGPRTVPSQRPRRNAFASSSKVPIDTPTPKEKDWHLSPPPPPSPSKQSQSRYNDPITRLKHPARGGRDLSARYVRLERALRGKEVYERDIAGLEGGEGGRESKEWRGSDEGRVKGKGKGKALIMFAGFEIPEVPKPPEPDECCMSGCAVCVHDLYAEALKAHRHALTAIRSALSERGVNEETWPALLRAGTSDGGEGGKAKEATLSAFEQMELQLAARRAQTSPPNLAAEVGKEKSDGSKMKLETDSAPDSEVKVPPVGRPLKNRTKPDGIDAKAVLEALSWVLFSRR